MKKLLLPLFILLLLGVGFLYVVKNPDLPISQKILTTLNIKIANIQSTGLDLTNCASYFDGCNTCTVKDGQPDACTLMYCETPAEPQCLQYTDTGAVKLDLTNCKSYFDGCNRCSVKDGQPDMCTEMYCETPGQPTCLEFGTGDNNSPAGIANPASVNCENNGGTLEILEGSGGQYGMCHLPDGTICEERAYYRGECKSQNEPTACTMEYAPVCARVAIQCIKAPCDPVEQTFGNKCTMKANKLATFLHDGECVKNCPLLSQPAPGFCSGGTIVDGGLDPDGCQLPPKCMRK